MQNAKRIFIPTLLVLFSLLIFGCQSKTLPESPLTAAPTEGNTMVEEIPVPEEKTLFVGPEKVDCVGVGPMECFQVKEDPDGEWQLFYDPIEGFEWEPGYTYELRVAVHQVENPPVDGSSLRYELMEIVDQVETPVEDQQPAQYITIEQPDNRTVMDAGQPITVSGRGAGLFEGNVVVQILDEAGNELALQPTIIQSPDAGIGGEGPWEVELSITIDAPTAGKIVAFSPSPKDGEGWLASDEVAVSFNPGNPAETTLENTIWQLTGLGDGSSNSALSVVQVTAFFDPAQGQVGGSAGCNRYFATYELDGTQLQIPGPIGATRMMCPDLQISVEDAFLAALEKVSGFEILPENILQLLDAEGNAILIFQVDPYSTTQTFSREGLANASYLNDYAALGVVQLVDGVYREPVAADSAAELEVMLTNFAAFGDIDGDGREDAAVVLISQPGGSGTFYDLAAVRKQDEALTNLDSLFLGDRIQIQNIKITNGQITIQMLTQGADDPMCCPTQPVVNVYGLENGKLVEISSDILE